MQSVLMAGAKIMKVQIQLFFTFNSNLRFMPANVSNDGFAKLINCFNLSDSQMVGLGCLIHSLQLCLEDQLLNLPSVKTLVEKSRRVAQLDNQSDKFHARLHQQKIQLQRPAKTKNQWDWFKTLLQGQAYFYTAFHANLKDDLS